MSPEIRIALNIADGELSRSVAAHLNEIGGCKLVSSSTNGSAPPPTAQLVLVEDGSELLEKLRRLRAERPEAGVFVLSRDPDPERVVEAMREGAAEYLLIPLDPRKLEKALGRVREKLRASRPSILGSVYSFISSKGGLGATVLAVNTAVALTKKAGSNVALVDNTHPAGDTSVLLDVVPDRTIVDLCRHYQRLDGALLQGAMTAHPSGLQLLAAPGAPEESEVIQAAHLGRVLELAKGLFEHTVMDCKSMSVDQVSLEAFQASDRIFIVTDLSVPAVRNAARLVRLIRNLRVEADKIEVVVNRFIKGNVPTVGEIEKTLGQRVFWLFPNDFGDVMHSINHGIPLVREKPRSLLARSVKEFSERLLPNAPPADAYRGVKGFLGRTI